MLRGLSGKLKVTPVRVPELDPRLRVMLEEHHCTIEEDQEWFIVTYPQGTTKQEWYPRTADVRFKILLPDGFEILEVEGYTGKMAVYAVIG